MTTAFLHADPYLPRCQEALARRALERTSAALRVVPTATLAAPAALRVAPWVARGLLARVQALRAGGLYLDARLIVDGDLRGLLELRAPAADAPALRHVRLLWAPAPLAAAPRADRDYDLVADEPVPGLGLLPEAWRPATARPGHAARVLDGAPRAQRPWVSAHARAGVAWFRGLRQALADGAVTRAELEQDVRAGLLRPSLLLQLDRDLDDARRLPAELLALDAAFPFAETCASAEQRALLASPDFRRRMMNLRWTNKLRAKGPQRLLREVGQDLLSAAPLARLRRVLGRREEGL